MEYAAKAKRMKLPNAYTAALTLKLREWKDEIWNAQRAAQKTSALQERPESVSDHDSNRSVAQVECRDERITHTEINPLDPQHPIDASFENVMRQLQESISKVDRLLSGKEEGAIAQ
jgi:anti-sigma28 factor (negative regulator of flagellin synthesis)